MSDFKLHTLGCGSARPSLHHQPSSTVLEHHGNLYLIDCGEGAQLAMMRKRLKMSRIRHIFLTHLHGDHVFGLPGLVGTLALSGVAGHLTIHTTAEGKQILSQILEYFNRDLPIDIEYAVFNPRKEEVIFENKVLSVRTIPLKHRVPCCGFVFEEKPKPRHINREMCDFHGVPVALLNRIRLGEDFTKPDGTVVPNNILTLSPTPSASYAHIGDTAYMPSLAEKIKGVTLLYHETTYLENLAAQAAQRGHSTALQAAQVARDAQAGALLTGHYSSRYDDDEVFREEARKIFPNVILNNEGITIDIPSLLK